MTIDELIAAGETLSRQCFALGAEKAGNIVGYWRGERADYPNSVPPEATAIRSWQHVLTIDTELLAAVGIVEHLPAIGFAMVESIRGDSAGRILPSTVGISELQCEGDPLYAHPYRSLPPFEALCLYGGDAISAWLKKLGLARHDYFQAASEPVAMAYQDYHAAHSPLTLDGAYAVVGGWHQMWPDDDFYLPLEMRLAVLTLKDAEPWYELWQSRGQRNWSVRERIT